MVLLCGCGGEEVIARLCFYVRDNQLQFATVCDAVAMAVPILRHSNMRHIIAEIVLCSKPCCSVFRKFVASFVVETYIGILRGRCAQLIF